MAINQDAKGRWAEEEFASFCRTHGHPEAHRHGQGFRQGSIFNADILGVPGIHFEIKRQERLRLPEWYAQAVRDSTGGDAMPVVAFRQNRQPWMVALSASDFFRLYNSWNGT